MKCERRDTRRNIDWSAVKGDDASRLKSMVNLVAQYVHGNKAKRQNAVNRKQIEKWFTATPNTFVNKALDEAVLQDRVRMVRNGLRNGRNNANAGYSYITPDAE